MVQIKKIKCYIKRSKSGGRRERLHRSLVLETAQYANPVFLPNLNSTLGNGVVTSKKPVSKCDDRFIPLKYNIWMENMKVKTTIGIDVSKDTLNISESTGRKRKDLEINNTKKAITRYLSKKQFSCKEEFFFVMEATGVYSLLIAQELHDRDFKVAVVNPLIIKRFSEMKMLRAKTDVVDAKIISQYGIEQSTYIKLYTPRPTKQHKMTRIMKLIDSHGKTKDRYKNQLKASLIDPNHDELEIKSLKNMIKLINSEVKKLQDQLDNYAKSLYPDEIIKLRKIKGVGPKTAAMILGFFGKFEHFESSKQVVSYIGINPSPYQSGTSVKGSGKISKKGNKFLRTKLYMSSLAAANFNPSCLQLRERLKERGKSNKQIRIAVANKLVRQIFAVLKFNKDWDPCFC